MFPIVIERPLEGRNATNWPGVVILDPDAPLRAATAAQEIWEATQKLSPLYALRVRFSRSYQRRMEVMGHAVEVEAAALIYGMDRDTYRAKEARSMRAGYDGLFSGYSVRGLEAAMEAVSDEAGRWVRRNRKQIERYK